MAGKSSKKAIKLAKGITSRTGYAGGGRPITSKSLAANMTPVEDNYNPDYNQKVLGQYLQDKFNRAVDLAKMPGDVLAGNRSFDPRSDADIADAVNLAGFAQTGGMGGVSARAGDTVLGSGPARQVATKTEQILPIDMSHQIADLLKQGRHKEITNEMLASADHPTLTKLYNEGATGEHMLMDYESRMGRANEMGYDQKRYRGIRGDEADNYSLNTDRPEGKMRGTGSWLSSDPDIAATYTGNRSESPATLPLLVQSKELKNIPWKGEVWSYGPKGKSTDEVGRAVREVGVKGVNFNDIVDVGPHLWNRVDHMKRLPGPSTTTMIVDPSIVRSPFALFDPRLNHLTHLNRKDGGSVDGAVDIARKHYAAGGSPFYGQDVYNQLMADITNQKKAAAIPVGQYEFYKGASKVPEVNKPLPEPSNDLSKFDYSSTGLYERPGGGGGNDSYSAIYGAAQPGTTASTSKMPETIDLTTGQKQTGKTGFGPLDRALANPVDTLGNGLFSLVPGFGPVSSISGMFGGPTFMSLSRGAINSLSKDSQPAAGIPPTIDLNTGIPNIGPPKADATLSNIADKGPVIGTGPYGPYTQKDVDAMANMMAGEAANQGVKGMAAVGAVAGNRAVSNYNGYGKSLQDQLSKPGQFLGYNNSNANSIMKGTDPQSKAVANQALSTARGILDGSIPSPVGNATDFNKASPSSNAANGGTNVTRLGEHTFFNAPVNYSGQTPRDQAVAKGKAGVQQEQQAQQSLQQAAQSAAGLSGQAKGDGTIGGEFGAFNAAPSPAPSGPATTDGTIGGETGTFGAAPSPSPSGQAANDGTIGGETGTFGAAPSAAPSGPAAQDGTIGGETGAFGAAPSAAPSGPAAQDGTIGGETGAFGAAPSPGMSDAAKGDMSISGETGTFGQAPASAMPNSPTEDIGAPNQASPTSTPGGATPSATPGGVTPGVSPGDVTPSPSTLGDPDAVAAAPAPSTGTQVASLDTGTMTDALGESPTSGHPNGGFGAGIGDGTIGGAGYGESFGGVGPDAGGQQGGFGGVGDGSISGESYGGGSWGVGDTSSSSSDSSSSSSDSSSSSSDSSGSSSDSGGQGDGNGGQGERRGGFIRPHRASGGLNDTPELRARLHELGSKAYDYGHGSFSPQEASEYNNLTNYYNFPRHVGSEHMTREDEDSAMLEHLQRNVGRGRTEESYATGGKVKSFTRFKNHIRPNEAAVQKALKVASKHAKGKNKTITKKSSVVK